MNEKNKEFIATYGLFAGIVVTIVGVGIFSYPRQLAASVGSDGWIVTLVAGVIAYFILCMACKVVKINNYNRFYNIMECNFGKFIGFLIALVFIFYNIFAISIAMRTFIEVIKMYLLEQTPTEFLLLVTILAGTYLIRGEIETLVRFNEIAFWVMFIPLTIVILFSLNHTNFTNIFPSFDNSPINYLMALKIGIYSFTGFSVIYLFLPFVKEKDKIKSVAFKSMLFVTVFYVFVVMFSLAIFGKNQNKILLWPTITMIKSINIPGAFVERWEGIVMTMWIIFYFTSFTNSYYLAADIMKDMFRFKDIKLSSMIVAPFVYLIAIYADNIAELYDISVKVTPILASFSLIILPILLIVMKSVKRKGGSIQNET